MRKKISKEEVIDTNIQKQDEAVDKKEKKITKSKKSISIISKIKKIATEKLK